MSTTHLACALAASLLAGPALAQTAEIAAPTDCLVIGFGMRSRSYPVAGDPIAYAVQSGSWSAPTAAGDAFPDSEAKWESCRANAEGWFEHPALRGGWAYFPIASPTERVGVLEITGHGSALWNGEPHTGDVYSYGYLRVPVLLRAGTNDLLVSGGRGRIRVRVTEPESSVALDLADPTLPDVLAGTTEDLLGAVVVRNATVGEARGLVLHAKLGEGPEVATALPALPSLSFRKVGFRFRGEAAAGVETLPLSLRLTAGEGAELSSARADIRVRGPRASRKITFESAIDGSVQYYGLLPASRDGGSKALVLTCHGAAVEGIGQADAYSPKPWADLVAPTNRRPYGFDWEDWGRLDAMEVLDHASQLLSPDPGRVYLTGHSMGGHGAWHLGVTYPDRFAATGPSAGWISLWSRRRDAAPPATGSIAELFHRAARTSDTFGLAPNLANNGVYVLHGEADDNVPVTEARSMRDVLQGFHKDWQYFEQPGAGHWWDNDQEPGAACVDWAPMFQFFSRHRLPATEEVRQVDFVTMSPSVSARCWWATVEMQRTQFDPSELHLRWDPLSLRLSGTTTNVRRLAIALPNLPEAARVTVALDGGEVAVETDPLYGGAFWLEQGEGGWELSAPASSQQKGPERCGPFRGAFARRVVLVYGTRGTAEENAWALARARLDGEGFYYRGNGSMDTVADSDFDPEDYRDRNVVLYGNRDTNSAFGLVLRDDEPLSVGAGELTLGDRTLTGAGYGCLFVRPRVDSHVASVGVIGGSGLAGMKATDRAVVFQSGAAYPDFLVLDESAARVGTEAAVAAGFFGESWDVETGEIVWRQ